MKLSGATALEQIPVINSSWVKTSSSADSAFSMQTTLKSASEIIPNKNLLVNVHFPVVPTTLFG